MTDAPSPFRVPVGTAANPVLDDASLAHLLSLGDPEGVEVGDRLFRAGDQDLDFFVIERGRVEVVMDATVGSGERIVSEWHAGEFLGELNMLNRQRSLLSARVAEAGTVRRIPSAVFRELLSTDGPLSDLLLSTFRARRRLLMNVADLTVQIIGAEGSGEALALLRYASRRELPHRWLDVATDAGRAALARCGVAEQDLPVVITADGVLRQVTPALLADTLGLAFRSRDGDRFDLVVVGAGPAGLAAGIYGASEGLSTLLLDEFAPGGQAASSSRIENYLGFPSGVSGAALTELATVQALKFGVRVSAPTEVVALTADGDGVRVAVRDGEPLHARAVIVTTGARYRRLPLDRWDEFEGGSIFFAATELEARACAGGPVVVVGGANSAGQASLYLAEQGSDVSLIIRGPSIRAKMSEYLVDRILADPRIHLHTSAEVTALHGGARLERVTVTTTDGTELPVAAGGLFCFVGAQPGASWLDGAARDGNGFLLTDVDLPDATRAEAGRGPLPFETSLPRVFAAGDVRHGSMKRVAAAVGEGASAVASVHRALAAGS